ncbi:uncharacterized protein METZ01_LOCUS482537, partial [marine metagenome]
YNSYKHIAHSIYNPSMLQQATTQVLQTNP